MLRYRISAIIEVSHTVIILDSDIEISAIRSQGADGQNLNKVPTAIHLRVNIGASLSPQNIPSSSVFSVVR